VLAALPRVTLDDIWDFLVQQLGSGSKAEGYPTKAGK
jgi:hypothetical protein